jgi:hypothetical protein
VCVRESVCGSASRTVCKHTCECEHTCGPGRDMQYMRERGGEGEREREREGERERGREGGRKKRERERARERESERAREQVSERERENAREREHMRENSKWACAPDLLKGKGESLSRVRATPKRA